MLLESRGFRPQNLQDSDFFREKSAPVVAVHAAGHDWNLSGPKPSRVLPAFFDRPNRASFWLARLFLLSGRLQNSGMAESRKHQHPKCMCGHLQDLRAFRKDRWRW